MPRLTSQHFVDCASDLLRENCGGDITLAMVLDACGAQKGSLYHFFPGGKEELLAAAVEKMRDCAMAHLRQCMEESRCASEGIRKHLHFVAKLIDRPDNGLGMPFLALASTIGENSASVQAACDNALREFEKFYSSQLVKDGFSNREAKKLAAFSVATVEGAIQLARLRGSSAPVKLAAEKIAELTTP